LAVIAARQRKSSRLWVLVGLILAFAFYAHPSMVVIFILPALLPFLVKPFRLFLLFVFFSLVPLYQAVGQALSGVSLASQGINSLAEAWEKLAFMFSWQNPLLLGAVGFSLLLFLIRRKKTWSAIKPYFFSLILVNLSLALMVFNIGFFNTIVLVERRGAWILSFSLLLFLAALVGRVINKKRLRVGMGLVSLVLLLVYVYSVVFLKVEILVPRTFKDVKGFFNAENTPGYKVSAVVDKYKGDFFYPSLSWSQGFDNYRADGLSYETYHWWNLFSPNPFYKGWHSALKGLPLHWSGLVSASEMGKLGEGGVVDGSAEAVRQALFWLDWYGIRHLQSNTGGADLADYLIKPPVLEKREESGDLSYFTLEKELITPIYMASNAPVMAVVAPEEQYKNFIRVFSFSGYSSKELIPIWLGSSLGAISKEDLSKFEAVFVYGYKRSFSGSAWQLLEEYVENGGKLIIETGQKVRESSETNLPAVFPISANQTEDISQAWDVGWQEGPLTVDLKASDLKPLKYKHFPFAISKAKMGDLRDWASPVLTKGEEVVMAYGNLEEVKGNSEKGNNGGLENGQVVWSGLNLPFHAIDNRNLSEIRLFANILDWFFESQGVEGVGEYKAEHPSSEEIVVSGKKAKGVLLKEHWNSGWRAKLVKSQKSKVKSLRIYKAGLLEMYVFLPQVEEFTVEFRYKGVPVYWVLFSVSLVSLAMVLIYFVSGKTGWDKSNRTNRTNRTNKTNW